VAVFRRQLLRGRGGIKTAALLRRNVRELGDLARRRRVAIVHSNYSLVLCGQGVADRAPAGHFLYMREIYSGANGAAHPMWALLSRRLLRADAIACVSEAVAGQFPSSNN
jgi:hypothetical protein